MTRVGKFSKIKLRSNKTFDNYNLDGSLKLKTMNKKERKNYTKKKELEHLRMIEENRLPKIKPRRNYYE